MTLAPYRKAVVAATAALAVLATALVDDGVTASEWVQVALAALGALGVWATPNDPEFATAYDQVDTGA